MKLIILFAAALVCSEKLSERKRVIKNVGELRFSKKGAMVSLIRKGAKLQFGIKKLEVNGTEKKDTEGVNFEVAREVNDTKYGLPANHLSVGAVLSNGGKINMSLHMFMGSGKITGDDNNIYNVVNGSLKFNLKIDWPEDVGDICITLKAKCNDGAKKAKKMKDRAKKGSIGRLAPVTYAICNKARMTFSDVYEKSGVNEVMKEGFPEFSMESSWGLAKLCFKGKSINYDPVAEAGDDVAEEMLNETSSSVLTQMSMILFFVCTTIMKVVV